MQLLFIEGLLSQVFVILLVLAVFFVGVYLRSFFDSKGAPKMSRNQVIVSAFVVFIFGGIPLCQVVHQAIESAENLYTVMGTFIPVFAAGFAAREEIKKHVPRAA